MPPVIYLDAAGDEDDTAAGGAPDGQRDGQEEPEQLLQNRNISDHPTSVFTSMISTLTDLIPLAID